MNNCNTRWSNTKHLMAHRNTQGSLFSSFVSILTRWMRLVGKLVLIKSLIENYHHTITSLSLFSYPPSYVHTQVSALPLHGLQHTAYRLQYGRWLDVFTGMLSVFAEFYHFLLFTVHKSVFVVVECSSNAEHGRSGGAHQWDAENSRWVRTDIRWAESVQTYSWRCGRYTPYEYCSIYMTCTSDTR